MDYKLSALLTPSRPSRIPGSSPGQACMGIFIVKRDHGGDLFFFASALGADALGSQRA
jgi:hypothetical protein